MEQAVGWGGDAVASISVISVASSSSFLEPDPDPLATPPSRTTSSGRLLFDEMADSLNTVRMKKDRFEDLPVHVLQHLLSFLPSQDAVKTCVLAKRWLHIWKSVPSLRILTSKFKTVDEDNNFVNKLIELRHESVPLHVCELVPYDDIESWLQYAASHQLQVLRVEAYGFDYHAELSNNSFISEHLTRLELYLIRFDLDHPLDLSSCQALEVFDIDTCMINLGDISFPKSLRHLKIKYSNLFPTNIRTRISAPGLVTCQLSDCPNLTPLFGSLPSVITAFIRFTSESEEECDLEGFCEGFCCKDDCSVLLHGLSCATNLELICDFDTMIFIKDLRWRPIFGNLKTVLLSDWCVTNNFTRLIYFLEHSPILERLTILLSPSLESFPKMIKSYTPRENFFLSKQLKVVEIKSCKVEWIQIEKILELLFSLGVNLKTITLDQDFRLFDKFSFEQKN